MLCPRVALLAHRINAGRAGQLLSAWSGEEVMGQAGGEMEQRRDIISAGGLLFHVLCEVH